METQFYNHTSDIRNCLWEVHRCKNLRKKFKNMINFVEKFDTNNRVLMIELSVFVKKNSDIFL